MNAPAEPELERLRDLVEGSLAEIHDVALVIQRNGLNQRHVGILYRDPDDAGSSVRVLDLQWHHALGSEPPTFPSRYVWAAPPVEPDIAYLLAKLCTQIAREYALPGRGLAYSLRYAGEAFEPGTGSFMTEDGRGLTCATFVMAVFASNGVPLLEWEQWPERPEDALWQRKVVHTLRVTRADQRYVDAANEEARQGCARFRPEEVAAGGALNNLPVGFADAERAGRRIVERLPPSPIEALAAAGQVALARNKERLAALGVCEDDEVSWDQLAGGADLHTPW